VTLRRIIMLAGAVVLAIGVIGMLMPVSVSDDEGRSVGCGNAIAADLSDARAANDRSVANVPILDQIVPHTDYVAECESAVSSRRSWTIPVAVIGALVLVGGVALTGRQGARSGGL